jgi:hypothetical protein
MSRSNIIEKKENQTDYVVIDMSHVALNISKKKNNMYNFSNIDFRINMPNMPNMPNISKLPSLYGNCNGNNDNYLPAKSKLSYFTSFIKSSPKNKNKNDEENYFNP